MLPLLLAIVYACLLITLSWYVINRRPSPRPRQQAAARRALAEVDRHQARRAIEVGMLEYQIHRNGDQVRQDLRREMVR